MERMLINGSSSLGNSYVLECGDEILLIELGVDFKNILKSIDYENGLKKVRGCLVTHKHKDHAKFIPQALEYGIPIYSCQEVTEMYEGVKLAPLQKKTKMGGFNIYPIIVPHSCECYAYLIEHPLIGRLLFATDCSNFTHRVKYLNHIFIECNHSKDVIVENLCNDVEMRSMPENHLELGDCIDALKENYSAELQTVCLIHLSDINSNARIFRKTISDELGFYNVIIADKGMEIPLEISEF